MPNEKVAG